ncbi:hypothetical protein FRX31_018240, partial [Thalictrum thalictroides]
NRSSFPFSSECFLSPLSDSLLRLTMTAGDGNCESMEFSDANKVDTQNFKEGSPDKIHGDRKVSSGGDVQIDSRIDGRMNADKRPDEMIRFNISEKETTQTLLESYQHLTPDQQHNRLDAHTTSSTWPKEQHPAQCHQDATSPNAENRKEHGSDDAEHSKSNVKRPSDQYKCKVSKKRRIQKDVLKITSLVQESESPHGDVQLEWRTHRRMKADKSELKQAEKISVLQDSPPRDGLKGSKFRFAEKKNRTLIKKRKEKLNGEMFNNSLASEPYPKAPTVTAPSTAKEGFVSDIVPAKADPVLIKENWVCCDSCEKWRLLPFGTESDHLKTDYWQCSMLNWL